MSRRLSHLLATVVLLAPALAAGNLRAPRYVAAAPSGALHAPAPGLAVTGEELGFACSDRCAVIALYTVTAERAARLAFDFILPVKEQVAVQVGPAAAAVQVGPAEPLSAREAKELGAPRRQGPRGEPVPLYRARFAATLVAGTNRIAVSYAQPLAALERDYGYFKKGRFVHSFQYEVWPLKEWTVAPGFTLRLTVTMPRAAPGWWQRTFGTVRSIACRGATGDAGAPLPGGRLTQRKGKLIYHVDVPAKALPDRLVCSLGDEDLIR